jgi:hypothetical protein
VTRMTLYNPWNPEWRGVLDEEMKKEEAELIGDKCEYLERAVTRESTKVGTLVVIAVDDENNPFLIAKVLKMNRQGKMVIQYYGNRSDDLEGTYTPGWVNKKKNRHYFGHKKDSRADRAYTNEVARDVEGNACVYKKTDVAFAGFKLTKANTLPASIKMLISNSGDIDYNFKGAIEEAEMEEEQKQ